MSAHKFIESYHEMETFLKQEALGYLGLSIDGQPYVVPLNYAYLDGKILFHCALEGKKLDHIASNPAVCFSVARQQGAVERHAQGDPCHMDCDSVVCYGTARVVDDLEIVGCGAVRRNAGYLRTCAAPRLQSHIGLGREETGMAAIAPSDAGTSTADGATEIY